MACQAMHSWTFSGLVGAFLDLSIAYFLLCASTLAFFASKFLGFFGLCLPCPCNGLFGNPNGSYCLHRMLVDCPIEKVSSVQYSVKSKFPFDSTWAKDQNYQLNLRLIGDRDNKISGFVEMEGEALCSSISNSRNSENLIERDFVRTNEMGFGLGVSNSPDLKQGRFDLKGKGVMNHRPRGGLRRRRKGSVDNGKSSYVSSCDPSPMDVQGGPPSPSSVNEEEMIIGNLLPVDSGGHANCSHLCSLDDGEAVAVRGERASHGFEWDEPLDESKPTEKDVSTVEEFRGTMQGDPSYDCNRKNEIRVLEQAREEEHTAQAALYLELEKERSAAATAADEAMAMILRLQEEKASIEMEARQYQRIIEEKSTYDAEQMNILEEILVRREIEKHLLEKQVEAYGKMFSLGNEPLEGALEDMEDPQGEQLCYSLDPSEDPIVMLHQLSNSIGKKEMENKKFSRFSDDGNSGFQEKGMVSVVSYAQQMEGQIFETSSQLHESSTSQQHDFLEKTIPLVGEVREDNDHGSLCQGVETWTLGTRDETEMHFPFDGEHSYQENNFSHGSMVDTELRIHDVHVVDDESNLLNEVNQNRRESFSVTDSLTIHRKNDFPSESSEIRRSSTISNCSDATIGLPQMGSTRCRNFPPDLRRNSISTVDSERLKIDCEDGWLRERLRVVQEGREKLNFFSLEHREREKVQLQFLEDIACHLQEIRQLTEPRKAVRQASLPPPSTKVMVKKRRCRSVSLGVHSSS